MIGEVSEYVQHQAFIGTVDDAYGNPTETWAAPTLVGVVAFDPGGSSEVLDGMDRVVTRPTLYLLPETQFGSRDRVTVRGIEYEVDGETAVWRHPGGWTPGNVVELRRIEG